MVLMMTEIGKKICTIQMGNGKPDVGEVNVDEEDEGRLQENDISLFPIIPTIGFSWEF